ncbi:MAG: response regulator transcription factor [Firmicutes bacterium]|nr:response regulator transcription factor [Bacillota bacterium]
MKILLAEDEVSLNGIIAKRLKKENFTVDVVFDGEEALDYLAYSDYDIVLLDIMMPKKTGLDVLKEMRAAGNETPVLILTAKDSVEDRVKGLDMGADDYVTKPFAFEELLARIRVLLRKKAGRSTNQLTAGDLILDLNSRKVTRDGTDIKLSSKEFSLLECFLLNKDIVLSRQKLETLVWGYEYSGASNMIDVYVRYLRKKIDEPFDKKLIHTVRGAGYVLREE